MRTNLPLDGVRVLDLTRALSGPFCTALLGDLGADVVKVESPSGDMVRGWGPFKDETSLYFMSANRNKRSIVLDLRSAEGRDLLRSMVGSFDVVVENFRPDVLQKVGLGAEWMAENHADVVIASISGFGSTGPLRDEPCFDQIAQGVGGLMSITGTEQSGPMRSGVPLADILTGMFAALGVCASLAGRRRGAAVQTSLLESVLGVLTFQAQRYLTLGDVPPLAGNDHPVMAPYGVFPTRDKPINLAVGTTGQWASLCALIGKPELTADPRFRVGKDRDVHRAALRSAIEERLVRDTAAVWLARFREAGIPAGPINDMAETFDHEQVKALEVVESVPHPELGIVQMVRGPLHLGGEATHVRRSAPMLGEHTREVLRECGVTDESVRNLLHLGVIADGGSVPATSGGAA
jgi:crotonobetainyl-CoA:carnitine CoA-transferase CaiB-like acyl-CoA transferase